MNPLTNVKNLNKMNQRELELGLAGTKTSWHAQYKDSAWVFIGGLPYDLTEGDVLCIFSQYGEIVNLNLVRDKDTGKSKGFCFICFEDQRSTILTVDNMNGIKVLGRVLRVDHVNDYKPPKEHGNEDEITMKVRNEGVAPKAPQSGEEEEREEELVLSLKKTKKEKDTQKKKKKKKEKKKKKDKKRKVKSESSESDSSDSDSNSQSKPTPSRTTVTVKTEKTSTAYDKYANGSHGKDSDVYRNCDRSRDRDRDSFSGRERSPLDRHAQSKNRSEQRDVHYRSQVSSDRGRGRNEDRERARYSGSSEERDRRRNRERSEERDSLKNRHTERDVNRDRARNYCRRDRDRDRK